MTQTDDILASILRLCLTAFPTLSIQLELSLVAASEQLNFGFYYFDHSITCWG